VKRSLTATEFRALGATAKDSVAYASNLLAADLWSGQRWILRSVATKARTAVKACHASGKTFAAALAVLWWISRYRDGIAVTTAPTWLQVERIIWGEIARAISHARISYPAPNATELELGPGNYAIGLSTNEADRFSGFHGMRVLMVLDEGPGVRPAIWEAIEGIRAGGKVTVLTLGNPVIASGPFHDAFSTQLSTWNTSTISAFDTPNLRSLLPARLKPSDLSDIELVERYLAPLSEEELDVDERPYLTQRRWVWEKWHEWGQSGNPLWDSRVMGRFPKQAPDSLYPLSMLEAAALREPDYSRRHRPQVGIDVAGPGEDETVVYVVEGGNVVECHAFNDPDPRGKVLAALRPWKLRDPLVAVDAVGLGHYFAEHLRDNGFSVRSVNVGKVEGVDTERFVNLKAQLHWALRERLEQGQLAGLTDETTISQLTSIRYKHDARGRVVVESKKELSARGVKSPDRAEALMLAYAAAPRMAQDVILI
jgi:phage terminase large subunit